MEQERPEGFFYFQILLRRIVSWAFLRIAARNKGWYNYFDKAYFLRESAVVSFH